MANEIQESFDKREVTQTAFGSLDDLNDYAMVRQSALMNSDLTCTDFLVGNRTLPALELADGESQRTSFKAKVPQGTDITTREMKESGVSARQEKDGVTETTTAEYPDIKVSVSNGKKFTTPEGHEITISNSSLVQGKGKIHESKTGSGVFVDEKGRAIAKVNDDGTVTVDSGKGFYTQGPDGIKRISAIRSRDGKDFEVIDTDTPLGNIRPSNMANHKR